MSVLRSIEQTLANLVEGAFGRAFRAQIRPVEIAHRLVHEMDDNRTVSLQRSYAPNEYVVWLSVEDRARYEGVEDEVIGELAAYLLEHARSERLVLLAAPSIEFRTDERLTLGECAIQARAAQPFAAPAQRAGGETMIFSNAERYAAPLEAQRGRIARASVRFEGRRVELSANGAVLGRSGDCDVVIGASDVSRRHARLMPTEHGWTIADLGSTNGVFLAGRRVGRTPEPIEHGAVIALGGSEVVFEIE